MLIFSTSITSEGWRFSFLALQDSFWKLGCWPSITAGPQAKPFSLVSGSLQKLCISVPANIRIRQCIFRREGRKEKWDLRPHYYLKHLEKPLQVIKRLPTPPLMVFVMYRHKCINLTQKNNAFLVCCGLTAWLSALLFHFPNLLLEQVGTSIFEWGGLREKDLFFQSPALKSHSW